MARNFVDKDVIFCLENLVENDRIQSARPEDQRWSNADVIDILDNQIEGIGRTLEKNAPLFHEKQQYILQPDNTVLESEIIRENWQPFIDNLLVCPTLPQEYGGLGLSYAHAVSGSFRVLRADAGFFIGPGLTGSTAGTLHKYGTKEQHDTHLLDMAAGLAPGCMVLTEPNAGSDVGAVKTTSHYENGELLVNGTKTFISGGHGTKHFVLARNPTQKVEGTKGISMVLVDRNNGDNHNGITLSHPFHKMGIPSSATFEVNYENSKGELIGEEGEGFKIMLRVMNEARLAAGIQGVAISDAALLESLKYANDRKQFSKEILQYSMVSNMLFNALGKTEMMRAMAFDLANSIDMYENLEGVIDNREHQHHKNKATTLTSMFKMYATEAAQTITKDCLQVFGGNGYIEEYPMSRFVRDARITTIYEGTTEIQASYCLVSQLQWEMTKHRKGHNLNGVLGEIVHRMDAIEGKKEARLAGMVKDGVKAVKSAHRKMGLAYGKALGFSGILDLAKGKQDEEALASAFNVVATRAKEYCNMIMEVYGASLLVHQTQFDGSGHKVQVAENYIREHMQPQVKFAMNRIKDISSDRVDSVYSTLAGIEI